MNATSKRQPYLEVCDVPTKELHFNCQGRYSTMSYFFFEFFTPYNTRQTYLMQRTIPVLFVLDLFLYVFCRLF